MSLKFERVRGAFDRGPRPKAELGIAGLTTYRVKTPDGWLFIYKTEEGNGWSGRWINWHAVLEDKTYPAIGMHHTLKEMKRRIQAKYGERT